MRGHIRVLAVMGGQTVLLLVGIMVIAVLFAVAAIAAMVGE